MTKSDFNKLLKQNVQFCLSIKALVESGADLNDHRQMLEELCDRSDALLKGYQLKGFTVVR